MFRQRYRHWNRPRRSMSEHTDILDAEFFAEQGTAKAIRREVGAWIGRHVAVTGQSHSFAWRKAFILLEEATGFRGPAKKTLDAGEKAGLLETLLVVVKRLGSPGTESVSAVLHP